MKPAGIICQRSVAFVFGEYRRRPDQEELQSAALPHGIVIRADISGMSEAVRSVYKGDTV